MNARLPSSSAADQALNAEQTIGHIAVHVPGATAVFRRLKLDFCCGGQTRLADAVIEKGLDLGAVMAELSALQRPATLAQETEPGALIDHIIARYHDVHRAQLPELIRMAHRVESVHRANPQVPAGLGNLLEQVQQELLTHMHKEEAILFPMLKSGGNPFVSQPIGMMRSEHVQHGNELDKINALTNDATPPAGACNTWRALYAGLAQLNEDLINHIHLENNVLFPQFDATTAVPAAVATAPAAVAAGTPAGSCGGTSGCGCS